MLGLDRVQLVDLLQDAPDLIHVDRFFFRVGRVYEKLLQRLQVFVHSPDVVPQLVVLVLQFVHSILCLLGMLFGLFTTLFNSLEWKMEISWVHFPDAR